MLGEEPPSFFLADDDMIAHEAQGLSDDEPPSGLAEEGPNTLEDKKWWPGEPCPTEDAVDNLDSRVRESTPEARTTKRLAVEACRKDVCPRCASVGSTIPNIQKFRDGGGTWGWRKCRVVCLDCIWVKVTGKHWRST